MPELSHRRRLIVLAVCCLSLLLVGMDVTIVNVALPSIRRDLNVSLSGLQWTIDAYVLVLASLLMLAGSTADRLGRRRIFQTGLVIFTVGSLLCSLAPGLGWLVAFRMVQAVGASMLNPVAMSIITNVFTEPRERARAIGVWGGVVGISLGLGPVVGGVLVETIGWRSIFWINIPIGLAAIGLTSRFVPESRAPRARRVDAVGQLLVMVALASMTYAIIDAPRAGWTSSTTLGLLALAIGAIGAMLVYEPRRIDLLVELRFFRSAPFSGATAIAICAFGAFSGFLFLNTLYLQEVRGLSALQAGLCTLPLAVMTLIFAPLSGRLVGSRGPRIPLLAAGTAMCAGGLMAGAPRPEHVAGVAARELCGLRPGIRTGQRADHEHGLVRDATQPGRGCRGDRVYQPPGRCGTWRRGGGFRAELASGRTAEGGLCRSQPSCVVDRCGLRARRARHRCADHGTLGGGHRGADRPSV